MRSFFISSTFKDMQAERDVLHQEVFPALRKRLREYGEDVQELDLRWGVDTSLMSEEDSGKHVIECCIDAIDRCRPYMVILIGERYGWIPDKTLLEQNHDERLSVWCQEEMSITQMEILYGAMKDENLDQCVFCFRDASFLESVPEEYRAIYEAESEKHRVKLAALKEKILANPKAHVMEYHPVWDEKTGQAGNLNSFGRELEAVLWEMLEKPLGEKKRNAAERVLQDAMLTSSMYLQSYIARQKEQEKGAAILHGRRGAWITGESGSGKSAYMASVAASARRLGTHVFLYYCGNENCGKTETFLDTFLYWLGLEYEKNRQEIPDIASLTRRQKLFYVDRILGTERETDRLILIDAADQMEEDISEILMLIAKNVARDEVEEYTVGMAVTSLPEYYEERKERLAECFGVRAMEPFGRTQINAFVQMHAARRGKHVDAKVVAEIRKKQGSTNPYYLSLVMQKLFMMSKADFEEAERLAPGMEGISRFMRAEIEAMPEERSALTISMLEEAVEKLRLMCEDVTGMEVQADPMEILKLLAVSEGGLKLAEIEAMIQREGRTFLPMFMERFFCYLYDSFGEDREGRWDFRHRLLRESLLQRMDRDEVRDYTRMLCALKLENDEAGQAFLYALKAKDISRLNQCIARILSDPAFDKRTLIFGCGRLLKQDGKQLFAEVMESPELGQDAYVRLLSGIFLSDTDYIWREVKMWKELYGTLCMADTVDPGTAFWKEMVGLIFLDYGWDREKYPEKWQRMRKIYGQLEHPGKEEVDACYRNLLEIMQHRSRMSLWLEPDEHFLRFNAASEEQDTVQMLAAFWKQIQDSTEEEQYDNLEALRRFLDTGIVRFEKEGVEGLSQVRRLVYEMMRGQQVILARKYLDIRKYQETAELTDQLMAYYQSRMRLLPSFAESYQYADVLECRSQAVRIGFREKYKKQELEVWTRLDTMYGPEMIREFLAYTNYTLGNLLERTKKDPEVKKGYDHAGKIAVYYARAIELYDRLLEERRKEGVDVSDILDWALYVRYLRMKRRMTRDIWFFRDEEKAYRFKRADFFQAQMDEDLTILEKGYQELYKTAGKDVLNRSLCMIYEMGALYYDMHQEEANAVLWCGKLISCQEELQGAATEEDRWLAEKHYAEAAKIYLRWGRIREAKKAAALCLETMEKTSSEWIQRKNRKEEQRRRNAELSLIQAQIHLSEKESRKAMACCQSAYTWIEEQKDEWEELPKTDTAIREKYMAVTGSVYHQAGDDAQAVLFLKRAEDFWKEEKQPLSGRNEAVMQRYFEMLKTQELRARITDDQKLLAKVIHGYRSIVENHTTDQDTSRRPLLLRQTSALAEYYRGKGWKLPEELEEILLITEDAREQKKLRRLEEKEEILQAEFKELCRDETVSVEKLLQKEEELNDLLCDMIQIWEKSEDAGTKIRSLQMKNVSLAQDCMKILWKKGENRKAQGQGSYVLNLMQQIEEEAPGTYPSEEQWELYVSLRGKRDAVSSAGEDGEADWMYLMGCCAELCLKALESTGKELWLRRLLSETGAYRDYMEKRIHENPSKAEWIREKAWNTYDYDQKACLLAGKKKVISIEQWILPYLESVRIQYETEGILRSDADDTKRLEALYALQDATEGYEAEIQHVIELLSRRQMQDDQEFYYYMAKAARDLNGETDMNVVMAYIQNLRRNL